MLSSRDNIPIWHVCKKVNDVPEKTLLFLYHVALNEGQIWWNRLFEEIREYFK